jgi:hypothetical protein
MHIYIYIYMHIYIYIYPSVNSVACKNAASFSRPVSFRYLFFPNGLRASQSSWAKQMRSIWLRESSMK